MKLHTMAASPSRSLPSRCSPSAARFRSPRAGRSGRVSARPSRTRSTPLALQRQRQQGRVERDREVRSRHL